MRLNDLITKLLIENIFSTDCRRCCICGVRELGKWALRGCWRDPVWRMHSFPKFNSWALSSACLQSVTFFLSVRACLHAKLLQPCLTLCKPMDCSPPSSSAHGILQARVLEWVAKSSSGDLADPGIEPVSALAGRLFTTSATWEALPP